MRICFLLLMTILSLDAGANAFMLPSSSFSAFSGDNTVKNWTASERSPENVNRSFDEWIRCFSSRDPSCLLCNQNVPLSQQVLDLTRFGENRCLPSRTDQQIAYSESLDEENVRRRDDAICTCFNAPDGPSLLERMSIQGGIGNAGLEQSISGLVSEARRSSFQGLLSETMRQERRHTAISALNLVNDGQDASELASRYTNTQSSNQSAGRSLASAVSGVLGMSGAVATSAMELSSLGAATRREIEAQPLTASELNADVTPPGFCLPYRSFVASEQFPVDPRFYENLDRMNGRFVPEDWNYNVLINRLADLKRGSGDVLTEEMIVLYSRLHYLQNNPILRNIFLADSSNLPVQEALFRQIGRMPRPICRPGARVCERSGDWMSRLNGFRREMAEFLRDGGSIEAAQVGAEVYSVLATNIAALHSIPDSVDSRFALQPNPTDASKWPAFCSQRKPLLAKYDMFQVELDVASSAYLPARDFVTPEMDDEYEQVDDAMCTRMTAPNGTPVRFRDYFDTRCPSPETRGCAPGERQALVDEFMRTHRYPANPNDTVLNTLKPFFNGDVPLTNVSETDANRFNIVAASPNLRSEPVVFRNSGNSTSGIVSEQVSTNFQTARINPATPAQPQAQTAAQAFASSDVFVPSLAQPGGGSASPDARVETPEVLREELSRGQSESRELQEEIAAMRAEIGRAPASDAQSPMIGDLNARLASLQRRLELRERDNQDLQRRITEVTARSRQEPERVAQRRPIPRETSFGGQSFSQGGGQVAQAEPVSGVAAGATRGGASLGPASVSSAGGGRAAIPSGRSAGGRNPLTSSGGAIIVSSSEAGVDYQLLRSQSENNVVSLPVSVEELNLVRGNDEATLTRILGQVEAAPGEVVRLNLTAGEGLSIEVFVRNENGRISLIQGPGAGRSIASDGLAEAEPEERARLIRLREELNQAN